MRGGGGGDGVENNFLTRITEHKGNTKMGEISKAKIA
jgi:hypothetical protein